MPLPADLSCRIDLVAPLGRPPRMGETIYLQAAFTGAAPTGVRFVVRRAGTTDVAAQFAGTDLDEGPAGTFRCAVTALAAGRWAVRAECTGPSRAADEVTIAVLASDAIPAPTQGQPILLPPGIPVLSADPQAALVQNLPALEAGVNLVVPGVRPDTGLARQVTLPAFVIASPRTNAATTNPVATDDSSAGYAVGSRWINTATGQMFNCISATVGAAIWAALDAADTVGPVSGGIYPVAPQTANGAAVVADTFYAMLLLPDFIASITALGARVTAAGSAGAIFKTAVLPHDTATLRPGPTALSADNAGQAATSTGQLLGSLAAAQQITPGRPVWVGGVFSSVATMPFVRPVATGAAFLAQQLGLGLGGGVGSDVVGFSTPFPAGNNLAAANAFLGAVWTGISGGSGVNWVYRII